MHFELWFTQASTRTCPLIQWQLGSGGNLGVENWLSIGKFKLLLKIWGLGDIEYIHVYA